MAPMFEQHRLRDEQERVAHTALRFLRSRVKLDEMVAAGASKGAIPFEEIENVTRAAFAAVRSAHSGETVVV